MLIGIGAILFGAVELIGAFSARHATKHWAEFKAQAQPAEPGGGAAVRLASFSLADGRPRPGLIVGDEVVDLSDAATGLPPTMAELLALGAPGPRTRPLRPPAGRRPVTPRRRCAGTRRCRDPPVILAIGMNYRAHVAELGREPPEWQYWFNKQRTSISGPGRSDRAARPCPTWSTTRASWPLSSARAASTCRRHGRSRWSPGFTIINDVSTRDWQWRTPTFTMGKSFDTHAPCGPELVTGDELGDPGALAIRTWVNDELRQDSTTADLHFRPAPP